MNIPLARPDITEAEIQVVVAVLRTPHLALGPRLKEFEGAIAEYAGVRYAVAVNSGTSALHLIIRALEIGEGDEVITTPFSFISSANCILFARGTGLRRHRSGDTVHRSGVGRSSDYSANGGDPRCRRVRSLPPLFWQFIGV